MKISRPMSVLAFLIASTLIAQEAKVTPLMSKDLAELTCKVGLLEGTTEEDYRFAPKASRRPSQSFTTNSRECHGMLASPRVNSTPWAAYSA